MNPGTIRDMILPHPTDPYARIAQFYDLEHDGFEEDLDLYLNLASVVGDPILELGCGSGRLLEPLAAAGHRVTGVDGSEPMLARARQRLGTRHELGDVQLVHRTFDDLSAIPGGPFGLAIIGLNGLMHVALCDAQRDMLCAVKSLLDPRGMLVLDLMHPTPAVLQTLDQTVVHEGSWQLDDGSHITKVANRRVFPVEQRIETELWYERTAPNDSVERTVTTYPMRWIYPSELELLLELAGYAEWKVYGSYELDPLTDQSDRLIITAEVGAS